MCGIAGILSPDSRLVTLQGLQRMTMALRHRGPNGEDCWIHPAGQVGLGHRRLSIIDLLAHAAQPMHYLHLTITYNGELYNYIELKQTLLQKGYTFTTASDTEVILAAYACYGPACLQQFDGMFAFAIWDKNNQQLFCARDRFGEKPFYYALTKEQFVFASEMKALWAAGVPRTLHPGMLANYIGLGLTTHPAQPQHTFFEGIYTLPAAHCLQVQMQQGSINVTIQRYWDIDPTHQQPLSAQLAAERLFELLSTSVRRRLRSDVPVGTSLSGGLDSSSIVAMIQQQLHQGGQYSHAAFSAVFPGFAKDEWPHIANVLQRFGLQGFSVSPTADELATDLQTLAWHQEEPFQSASIYAQYRVYQLAKQQGVTVLLDGQGADEILAGYHTYYHWYWQQLVAGFQFNTLTAERRHAIAHGANIPWGWKNYMAALVPGMAARQLQKRAARQVQQQSFLNPEMLRQHQLPVHKPVVHNLNDVLYHHTMQDGLGSLLRYADRNSMAHSREVRLPFLSHELVEFVFAMPPSYKIKKGFTKWLLRQAMQPHLPQEIVWRTDKIGFEPPQAKWLQSAQMQPLLHQGLHHLVDEKILLPAVLKHPPAAADAHARGNLAWRYLSASLAMQAQPL